MRRHLRQLVRRARRPLGIGLVLLGYLVTAFGFPVPARTASGGGGPCGRQVCGCAAEARAAGTCCCAPTRPRPAPAHACCIHNKAEDAAPSEASCCHEEGSPAPVAYRFVLGEQFQKCRGLQTLWVQSGAVLTPPAIVSHPIDLAPCGWLVTDRATPLALATPPPSPPPRLAA